MIRANVNNSTCIIVYKKRDFIAQIKKIQFLMLLDSFNPPHMFCSNTEGINTGCMEGMTCYPNLTTCSKTNEVKFKSMSNKMTRFQFAAHDMNSQIVGHTSMNPAAVGVLQHGGIGKLLCLDSCCVLHLVHVII